MRWCDGVGDDDRAAVASIEVEGRVMDGVGDGDGATLREVAVAPR
jgi:hypothetical protein